MLYLCNICVGVENISQSTLARVYLLIFGKAFVKEILSPYSK